MDTKKSTTIGEQEILRDLFVIRSHSGEFPAEKRKQLDGLGAVRDIMAYPQLLLLRVDEDEKAKVRDTWSRLQEAVGEGFDVFPVMLDESGNQKYPVGRISVRFSKPPSDDEVTSLANEHELSEAERNEYSTKQVAFAFGRKFLPDLLNQLKGKNVRSWPETISGFQRGE